MFQLMTTPNNRIAYLREMIALEEKRAVLQGQIAELDSKLAQLQGEYGGGAEAAVAAVPVAVKRGRGRPAGKAAPVAAPAPSGRKGRGALREQILQALSAAGPEGITVQELATLLSTKTTNIHSWFSTNAKKISGLKKVGEAKYALNGGGAAAPAKRGPKPKAEAPVKEKAAPAAKPAKAAKGKRGGSRRGEMKEQIIAELRNAGDEGITIKDLADKLGANYKNVYIWFVTTGKRIPGIEKVGPARYKLSE